MYNMDVQRDAAILEVFYKNLTFLYRTTGYATIEEVIDLCMQSQAPRFFVSAQRAMRYISLMRRGIPVCFKNSNRQRMYTEIYRRFISAAQGRRPACQVMKDVLAQPAPSFYINRDSFRHCVYTAIKRRKKCTSF